MIWWRIEAFIYSAGPDDWTVNVKAEIDLDDRDDQDRCVLNEQQLVTDSADLAAAVCTPRRRSSATRRGTC